MKDSDRTATVLEWLFAYLTGASMERLTMPIVTIDSSLRLLATERVGRAMLSVARNGYPTPVLENADIDAVGAAAAAPPALTSSAT